MNEKKWAVLKNEETFSVVKNLPSVTHPIVELIAIINRIDPDSGEPLTDSKRNAELIVEAVNNRDRLLKAVKLSRKALDHWLDHEAPDTLIAHRACEIALSFEEIEGGISG